MKKENIIITVNSCGKRKSATFLQHLKKLSEEYTIVLNIKKEENELYKDIFENTSIDVIYENSKNLGNTRANTQKYIIKNYSDKQIWLDIDDNCVLYDILGEKRRTVKSENYSSTIMNISKELENAHNQDDKVIMIHSTLPAFSHFNCDKQKIVSKIEKEQSHKRFKIQLKLYTFWFPSIVKDERLRYENSDISYREDFYFQYLIYFLGYKIYVNAQTFSAFVVHDKSENVNEELKKYENKYPQMFVQSIRMLSKKLKINDFMLCPFTVKYAEKKSKIFAKNPLAAVPRCDIPVIGSQYCMNFSENMSDEKILDTVDWRKILNGNSVKWKSFINTI